MAGVAAATFVSTSLDNLFLLMGIVGGSSLRTRDVALGYGASVALVMAVGVAGNLAADTVSPQWLRALGLVPLGMGLWRVRGLLGGRDAITQDAPTPQAGGIASVFGVMLASSGDSLVVFASLMAETADAMVVVIIFVTLAMSGVWAVLARWFLDHPSLAPLLRRLERYAVPLLLVALGLYILLDTSTDTV